MSSVAKPKARRPKEYQMSNRSFWVLVCSVIGAITAVAFTAGLVLGHGI